MHNHSDWLYVTSGWYPYGMDVLFVNTAHGRANTGIVMFIAHRVHWLQALCMMVSTVDHDRHPN
jgi:hypothetical protein